jgi:hypothetical protein
VQYFRTYTGRDGETYGEDVDAPLIAGACLPGSPPANLSAELPAVKLLYASFPPGWYWDWHPSPRRQLAFTVAGVVEVSTSKSGTRRLGPGSVWLHEDTTGKGHDSRVVSADAWQAVLVVLPD